MSAHSRRCRAIRLDGSPCRTWALRDGSGLCRQHQRTPEERIEYARSGGIARGKKARARREATWGRRKPKTGESVAAPAEQQPSAVEREPVGFF